VRNRFQALAFLMQLVTATQRGRSPPPLMSSGHSLDKNGAGVDNLYGDFQVGLYNLNPVDP
jgi:hypothetical protein